MSSESWSLLQQIVQTVYVIIARGNIIFVWNSNLFTDAFPSEIGNHVMNIVLQTVKQRRKKKIKEENRIWESMMC